MTLSRIKVMPFTVTTNASGYVQTTKMLDSDMIVGRAVSFSHGNFETIEFFDLYVYTRQPDSDDVTEGGGSGSSGGGGGGGGGGAFPKSPPALNGTLFRKGDELVIAVKNATASTVYHVLLPYQTVKDA